MNPEPINWAHIAIEGSLTVLPILVTQWLLHRSSSKEAETRDQRRDFMLAEHVPHTHREEEGPLQAENIAFPKVKMNGK